MKKLFLGFGILISSLSLAQIGVGFGIKGGLNVSSLKHTVKGNTWDNLEKSKTGYYAGVFMNVHISKFYLQPEILYTQMGNKFEGNGVSVDNHLDYISVPVMLQYKVFHGLYLEAGPQFNFLVNKDLNTNSISDIKNDFLNLGINQDKTYKTFDLAIGVGAGYRIFRNIGINARYVFGITEDSKIDNLKVNNNNSFQVGATLGF